MFRGTDALPPKTPKAAAAGLIRAHFWQPRPPAPTKDGRPWTMARELDVWATLARRMDPEALNGAIGQVRHLTGSTGPISMRWFLHRPPLLARAVAAWENSVAPAPSRESKRGGGFARLVVEPPPPNPGVDQ